MAIPTVTEVEEFKEDLDDAEALVNGFGQVQTRLGGLKDSYSLLVSRIAHGDIAAYSDAATYTEITDWVTESGIVYRPDPAQLPIGPESFDSDKWFTAQGYTQADGIVAPVETYAAALALPTSLPLGAIVPIYGDGIAGDFVVTSGAISDSSAGVLLSNATWNAAGKHLKRVYGGIVAVDWFLPDGTVAGDSAAAQAAIDTGAKNIYFNPNNSYTLYNVTAGSNVRLFSVGEGSVICADTKISTDHGFPVTRNIFDADSVERITIENIIIDGSIVDFRTGSVPYTELECPIQFVGCSHIEFKKLRFRNVLTQGPNNGTRNQKINRGMIAALECSNILIEHCEIEDSCYVEGFLLYDCTKITVQHNYSLQERDGYRISSPLAITGLNTEDVLIQHNRWIGHGGSGVNLVFRRNAKILDNTIRGRGIDISNEAAYTWTEPTRDLLIRGNTIDYTGQSEAVSGYPSASNVTGITVFGDPTYPFENIKILDNTLISAKTPIVVEVCKDVLVDGNTVINPNGNSANWGRGIAVNDSHNIEVCHNTVNGLGTAEFGAGTHNIYAQGNTGVLNIHHNTLDEVTTNHINIGSGNEKVVIENNTFTHDATTPTRNIFGASDGAEALIERNNNYKHVSNVVNPNQSLSGGRYGSFEFTDIFEIEDDAVYQLVIPVDHCVFEMSSNNGGYTTLQVKDGGSLETIFLPSSVTKTTGVLTGTTGTDGNLTLSVNSSSIYIENRTGSTKFFKVQVR